MRQIRPPKRFSPSLYSILLTVAGEPECYDKAVQVETKIQWEFAMKEEMGSLLKHKTWDLQNKWVYRLKEEDGGKKRLKFRLVVKGFTHKK